MSDPIIKLIIVDDHEMVRNGLKVFIDNFDHIELVAEASDGEQAIMYCHEYQPDVVLMDIKMKYLDGITALGRIKEKYPDIEFIMLTSFVDEEIVSEALQAGALGYLLKTCGVDDLKKAIENAYHGKSMLSPEATQALISSTVRKPKLGHDLTEREIEILQAMVHGLNNKEIGEMLYISPSTVKNHLSNIFDKLKTNNRTEAAALAIQYEIVSMDNPNEQTTFHQ